MLFVADDDLRFASIEPYQAGHANGFPFEGFQGIGEMRTLVAPDDNHQRLIGIGSAHIQKGRLFGAAGVQIVAVDGTADPDVLINIIFGLIGPNGSGCGQEGKTGSSAAKRWRIPWVEGSA